MNRHLVWGMAVHLALVACPKTQEKPAAQASQQITAWWKTEDGQAPTTVTGTAQPVQAGWTKLSPINATLAKQGAQLFSEKGCVSCHTLGKGDTVGPDLKGITRRAEPDWVRRFIANPDQMLASDPRAKQLLAKYLVRMPKLTLTDPELDALLDFLRQQDQAPAR